MLCFLYFNISSCGLCRILCALKKNTFRRMAWLDTLQIEMILTFTDIGYILNMK
jgi:hypothetical protein